MPTAFPYGICLNLSKNHKAVKDDNKINAQTYNLLINENIVWYCFTCSKKLFPFSALNGNDLHATIQGKTVKFKAFN